MKQHESYQFERFWQILKTLRGPHGCPWDLEQTSRSIKGNLIEEAYECVESINQGDSDHMCEELGDILLVAMLMICIEQQSGNFTLTDVLRGAADKLVRRHPHVFGDSGVEGSDAVIRQWEQIKADVEGRGPKDSLLDSVPATLPPLERAAKLQKKASKVGFDWPDLAGAREKLSEELREFDEACDSGDPEQIDLELGDVLFSVINVARKASVSVNESLYAANARFCDRFRWIEGRMQEDGIPMSAEHLQTMEKHWNEAKNGRSSNE